MKKKNSLSPIIVVLIIIGAFAVFVFGTYGLLKLSEGKYYKKIDYETYENLVSTTSSFILYVGDDEATEEVLKVLAKENKIAFKKIDEDYAESLGLSSESLVVIKDGEIVDTLEESIIKTNVNNLLVNNGYLSKGLQEITVTDYLKLINNDKFVVFLGSSQCGYCTKYQPIVQAVVEKYNVEFYYINLYESTETEIKNLYDSSSWFTENDWGTPTTLLFSKGKIVDYISGYVEENVLVEFLKTNGVI